MMGDVSNAYRDTGVYEVDISARTSRLGDLHTFYQMLQSSNVAEATLRSAQV